jgi:glycosyltransferase involved in cell wall biosynthesis
MPVFSVVIPLYNKEQDIAYTLDAVLKQDFEDFEVVVVDDGSTDGSLKVVQQIVDKRLKIFSKQNQGVGPTRNFGIQKARGELIAFLDGDDLWLPHHLSDIYRLQKNYPEARWFCTAYTKRFNKKLNVALESPIMKNDPWSGVVDDYFGACLVESISWTSAVCFKKAFLEELGGFDTSITHGAGEDTDLWIRAALRSAPVFTTRISAIYNLEGSNRISFTPTRDRQFMDPDNYEAQARSNPQLKKYLDLNRFSYGLRQKMAGDKAAYNKFIRLLDHKNLNQKQRLLLAAPRPVLRLLTALHGLAGRMGFRLSVFK